jgi:hypothetical protein
MSPVPRTVVALKPVRASHSWTAPLMAAVTASHSWTFADPHTTESDPTDPDPDPAAPAALDAEAGREFLRRAA